MFNKNPPKILSTGNLHFISICITFEGNMQHGIILMDIAQPYYEILCSQNLLTLNVSIYHSRSSGLVANAQ